MLGEAPISLPEITVDDKARINSMEEFDRVLGGGLVKGEAILVGGAPGIGKSTLLLQISSVLAQKNGKVLYISGEESLTQTKLRAQRLNVDSPNLYLCYETRVLEIVKHISEISPILVVVDSIQTLFSEELSSAPGSVGQVRESAALLIKLIKSLEIPIILVGHITKDGAIAGPMVLEHMVDVVLYFEGETHANYRLLRAVKNRFGGTQEVGIFTMDKSGLKEVKNVSEFFLAERVKNSSGSIVVAVLEGYRPLLVEVQALVSRSYTGIPRRAVVGVDPNRVNILTAVLEKRCRLSLGQWDLFINVVGAMKIKEAAADLGIMVAIASSFFDAPLPYDTIIAGEVGLGGEIRAVSRLEARLQEGRALGFSSALIPQSQLAEVKNCDMNIIGVSSLAEALFRLNLNGKKVTSVENPGTGGIETYSG